MSAPPPGPPHDRTALQAALERAAQPGGGRRAATRPAASPGPGAAPLPARSVRRAGLGSQRAALQAAQRPAAFSDPAAPPPIQNGPTALPAQRTAPARRRTVPAPRRAVERVAGLHELAQVARRLRDEQERQIAEDKARRESAARAEAEKNLFSRSVGPVTPLRNPNLARLRKRLPAPLPVQHWLDEERVLHESISDDFDVSTLLDTDDQLSFRRPGIGVEVTRRLRSGHWSIQRHLDLHGLRVDEAREALGEFIRHAHRIGLRCVRVVHGKGLGSPGKAPVLKGRVQRWLVQKSEVLAFVQARPMEGGAGALVVLLQPAQRKNP